MENRLGKLPLSIILLYNKTRLFCNSDCVRVDVRWGDYGAKFRTLDSAYIVVSEL